MLKNLKSLVKRRIASDALLNVDFVVSQGPYLLILGWAGHRINDVSMAELTGIHSNSKIDISIFRFSRMDVVSHHNLPSNDYCFGFLVLIKGLKGNLDQLSLCHSSTNFPLAKQRFKQVDNVAEILTQVAERQDEAREFVEKSGVVIGSLSTVGQVLIRHRDKDVEKIKGILQGVDLTKPELFERLQENILPEVHKIWKAKQSKNNDSQLYTFGTMPEAPLASIIVPLYGRYDFVQHQVANFSADSSMADIEVIYVLDDPSLTRELLITSHGLHQTFKFPFKVVVSERNRGFAGANNLGAEYVTSEILLLLNSDILPVKYGWITEYVEQFLAIPNCGILGATLIYEDHTIQHAGMEFREDSHYPGIWMNHHPYKGVPVELVNLEDAFNVSNTTGACMMIRASDFAEVEGFDPMYVLGDFEDSDLCLKVINKDLQIFVSGKVRFFHLERLSQNLVDSGDWKFKLTLANGVYQVSKWKQLIERLAV